MLRGAVECRRCSVLAVGVTLQREDDQPKGSRGVNSRQFRSRLVNCMLSKVSAKEHQMVLEG